MMNKKINALFRMVSRVIPSPIKKIAVDAIFKNLRKSSVTLKKPIFIWGTGRSGTHLLYDIMSLNPDVCFVKVFERWKKGLWGMMHYGDTTPEKLKGYPIPVEGVPFIWEPAGVNSKFYGIMTKKDINKINNDCIITNYMKLAMRWKWKKSEREYRILDKSPIYIMMIELINNIFPDSYHIFCIRDPRAVVNSILRIARFTSKEVYEKEYSDGFFSHMYPNGYEKLIGKSIVEILCWQVEQLILLGFKYGVFLNNRLIPFRYEELLNNAHNCATYLYKITELSEFDEIRNLIPKEFEDYSPNWPEKGKRFFPTKEICFSSSELEYFENIESLAQSLGYDVNKVGKIVKSINLSAFI